MGDYVIKTGDTLSKLALSELGDIGLYVALAKANGIEDPNKIYIGDKLNTSDSAVANALYDLPKDIYSDDYALEYSNRIGNVMLKQNEILKYQNSRKKPTSGGSAPTAPSSKQKPNTEVKKELPAKSTPKTTSTLKQTETQKSTTGGSKGSGSTQTSTGSAAKDNTTSSKSIKYPSSKKEIIITPKSESTLAKSWDVNDVLAKLIEERILNNAPLSLYATRGGLVANIKVGDILLIGHHSPTRGIITNIGRSKFGGKTYTVKMKGGKTQTIGGDQIHEYWKINTKKINNLMNMVHDILENKRIKK